MSQSNVTAVYQDTEGFMWFGTTDGLNRYDGHNLISFRSDPDVQTTLSNNYIEALLQTKKGLLWVGTQKGLNRYDLQTGLFSRLAVEHKGERPLVSVHVTALAEDDFGDLWIATKASGLYKYSFNNDRLSVYRHDPKGKNSLSGNEINSLSVDAKGRVWIGTNQGLDLYDPKTQRLSQFTHQPQQRNSLAKGAVMAIHSPNADIVWVGTFGGGLTRFDVNTGQFVNFVHQPQDAFSLSDNAVVALSQDKDGKLWVGTDNGLNHFDPVTNQFHRYLHHRGEPYSISSNQILDIYYDDEYLLWIGTDIGGVNLVDLRQKRFGFVDYDPQNGQGLISQSISAVFQDHGGHLWVGSQDNGVGVQRARGEPFIHLAHDPQDSNSIGHGSVWSIAQDHNQDMWFATFGSGLSRFNPRTQRFSHFKHKPQDRTSLSNDWVWSTLIDSHGQLWVGTYGGLNKFDFEKQHFERFIHHPNDPNSIGKYSICAMLEDSNGDLWLGTWNGGVSRYEQKSQRFIHYTHDENDPHSISSNIVMGLYEDRQGIIWMATYGGGLNRYDRQTDRFSRFREKDGLANDSTYSVLEDDDGFLWVATNKGLAKFDPIKLAFMLYDFKDGLQSNEFSGGAAFKAKDGELFFAGINGLNRFYPRDISVDNSFPAVRLTNFMLFNKPVGVGRAVVSEHRGFALPKSIGYLNQLDLSYKQSLVSFEFVALDFRNPLKSKYFYKLEGFDQDWNAVDAKIRLATYTRLPAGDYIFRVKASNADGVWNNEGIALPIHVAPAPWFSWWAWMGYAMLAIVMGRWYFRRQQRKIEAQKAVNRQLKQVDKLKDEFLANTSHELRTPLNGIIGLAESLIDGATGPLPEKTIANLAMVVSSGKRLANLVNDILDFSKLKTQELSLYFQPVDLRSMVDVIITLSQSLIGDKKLRLINDINKDLDSAYADEDRLSQIFHNLIGNAIKFTDQGEIIVGASVQDGLIYIWVRDTGIGIPEDKFEVIFESFEQVQSHSERMHGGTGLGLAVTKQLVELHGGQITLTSVVGVGTTISFCLPISTERAIAKEHLAGRVAMLHDHKDAQEIYYEQDAEERAFKVLIVDDEPVNRQVLHNHLSTQNYNLYDAGCGEEALNLVRDKGPFDLILLDIMMPRMSGYEVCKQLREQYPVCDLPIIFLTAKNQVADLVQSFEVGANDFLSKPVGKNELLTRVKTHLNFLDINRNLEAKVTERTQALQQKNQEIMETQQQLVQSEKMASLGVLTAGVAHEINNPANFIHVSRQNLDIDLRAFQRLLNQLAGDEAEQELLDAFTKRFNAFYTHTDTIEQGVTRISNIVKDLRIFSQLDAGKLKEVDLTKCLQSTINLLRNEKNRFVEFITDFSDTAMLKCYSAQLNQVFINLLSNACDAIATKTTLSNSYNKGVVTVSCHDKSNLVMIKVEDNGCGIEEQHIKKIFEPFYTTKNVGDGSGLGLSIAYGIVRQHNGQLSVTSKPGKGSAFILSLPKAQ